METVSFALLAAPPSASLEGSCIVGGVLNLVHITAIHSYPSTGKTFFLLFYAVGPVRVINTIYKGFSTGYFCKFLRVLWI